MGREKKKGTSGNAKAFITRAKAIRKLQLSLEEFRRLCILKGVYPREPRKKLEGTDKTYYLRKDIDFLAHERLIATIRNQNSHKKKVIKAKAKKRIDLLKRLSLSAPRARLDHLIVERYPRFEDAIRELDDPLCIVALFANLPAHRKVGIAPRRVTNCQRLLKEFHHFVAESNALKRVFVSVKGYYFQASLFGEEVTWVTPHRFSQVLPSDVDYSVMLTFLELYECMMSFVNFRLYTARNLAYPPKIIRTADANGLELSAVQLEKAGKKENATTPVTKSNDNGTPAAKVSDETILNAQKMVMSANAAGEESEEDEEMEIDDKASDAEEDENEPSSSKSVFAGKCFVLGREVPYIELEFALMASGASKVTREDDIPPGPDRLSSYDFWIIDRPKVSGERDMSLEYVQPQYVFDTINATVLLPTSLYAPGSHLPPHLSPFVTDDDDGGYRPWYKDVLERIKSGDTSVVAEAAAKVYAEAAAREKKKDISSRQVDKPSSKGKVTSKGRKRTTEAKGASKELDERKETEGEGASSDEEAEESKVVDGKEEQSDEEEVANDSDGDESESDEEGEDEAVRNNDDKNDKEEKDMAALMLSRNKMRVYTKVKRAEEKKNAVKDRLLEKRRAIETETAEIMDTAKSPKRRKTK